MPPNVVYRDGIAPTVEGVRSRLTPQLYERMRTEAGYDDAVAKREYPQSAFDGVVKIIAAELFGNDLDEGTFQLGLQVMMRYRDSVVGKAIFPIIRFFGPMRFLKRVPSFFRQVNNYAEVKVVVENKSTFTMEHNEVGSVPHYFRGVMHGSAAVVGLQQPKCELLAYDGHRGTYRISWVER
ncbi:MAG: DUF2378 family protein [Myxococcaceae bacterium]|nr:DUF2378 family protein [Myxococcaceae bacterium]